MNARGHSYFRFGLLFWLRRVAVLGGLLLTLGDVWALAGEPERPFLTAQEITWVNSHAAQVRVAPEGNYPPFSFIESGAWHGLSADMTRLLQERLGLKFTILPAQNLETLLTTVQRGNAEIITSLRATPERSQYLSFTQPYVSVPTAILVQAGFTQGRWPDTFYAKRVAVGKGYGVQAFLEKNFPAIKLTLVPDDLEGMRKLSFGEVDAVIMDVASASFFIEREKITNLRIFETFDYTYDLSFGVRKDMPQLRDILSKTLGNIPERDRQAVLDKWITIRLDPLSVVWAWIRHWLLLIMGVLAALVLSGVMAWRAQRQRRRTEKKLARYSRSLLEASLDPLVTISAEGKITDVNSATEKVTGVGRSALIGSDFADYCTNPVQARQGYQQVFANGFVTDYPLSIRHTNGQVTDVLYNASVYRDDAGQVLGVFAAARDVTERKKAESYIQAASVFTYSREGILITREDGTILNVNDAFTRITGYDRDEVLGKKSHLLRSERQSQELAASMLADLCEKNHWCGEAWSRRKNGEKYLEAQTIIAVRGADGRVEHYVTLFSDITAVKAHLSQLEQMAHFDTLTNLPNRLLLTDRLRQNLAQAERSDKTLAVVYLDLDGFKAINDQHGHEAGDFMLITVANRMRQALREGDTLARLGGDEFVAVMGDLADEDASLPMLNRLLASAALPVVLGEQSLQVSASIGVTFYPQPQAVEVDQLLRQADQAMYQAKLAGKGCFHIFDARQDTSLHAQHDHLERIQQALSAHEFVLYFQPKVNMRTGQVIGAEALIRWQHPERGLLAPAQFLPAIEGHPLAIVLGEWIIDAALTQIVAWRTLGLDLAVSVNIGARQLQQADFVARLRAILAAHPHVNPTGLELEILEATALENMTRMSQLVESCAQLGIHFSLDDFGAGYLSLTYLKRLRVTTLKIDPSFVHDMLDDPDDLAILKSVIALAVAFKREIIAEGVETEERGRLLLQLGCDVAQGYGIARPMSAQDIPAWVAAWQRAPTWNNLPGPPANASSHHPPA